MNELNLSVEVHSALIKSGWFPGRFVDISEVEKADKYLFPAARTILNEFYGLYIGECGTGEECATSDFLIDPLTACHLFNDISEYENIHMLQLFPLGEVHRKHGYALIDENGQIFLLNGDLEFYARTFQRALLKFIKGHLPDQQ